MKRIQVTELGGPEKMQLAEVPTPTPGSKQALVRIAAAGARTAGAEVTLIELEDFALPLFNQDDEAAHGLPENARKLKDLMLSHQGFWELYT